MLAADPVNTSDQPPSWRWLLWLRKLPGRPVRAHLSVLMVYLGAGIVVTWPRAAYLTDHRLPALRDASLFVWDFWWMARCAGHFAYPWFTRYEAAPTGAYLGFHTLMPLPGLLMTPVTAIFGPSFSYNLLSAAAPGLMCYAMYRAARLWLPSGIGAFAAGAFFGLSTMLAWNAFYELNLALGATFLPLALEAAVRLRRRPDLPASVTLGLVLAAALLTDQESAVLACILTAAALAPWLLSRPAKSKMPWWARLRAVTMALVTGIVFASPQIFAMIQQAAAGAANPPPSPLVVDYMKSGASPVQMFGPSPRVGFFGFTGLASIYAHGGPQGLTVPVYGVVVSSLAIIGVVVARRRRAAWLFLLLWVASSALALGAVLRLPGGVLRPDAQWWHGVEISGIMPFTWFVRLPGLSGFREADRITELGLVGAALLAGAAVNWLRYRARPALVVVLALGVLEAGTSGTATIGRMPTAMPELDSRIAADHSSSIVVDVPFGIRGGVPLHDEGAEFDPEALVQATADGHPRAVAYLSRLSLSTMTAVTSQPFYSALLTAQLEPHQLSTLLAAGGGQRVSPLGEALLNAARANVVHMRVGWAIVWRHTAVILRYLDDVGFRFDYRVGPVLVYRYEPGSPAISAAQPTAVAEHAARAETMLAGQLARKH